MDEGECVYGDEDVHSKNCHKSHYQIDEIA